MSRGLHVTITCIAYCDVLARDKFYFHRQSLTWDWATVKQTPLLKISLSCFFLGWEPVQKKGPALPPRQVHWQVWRGLAYDGFIKQSGFVNKNRFQKLANVNSSLFVFVKAKSIGKVKRLMPIETWNQNGFIQTNQFYKQISFTNKLVL